MSALSTTIALELRRAINAKLSPQHMIGGGQFDLKLPFPRTISTEVYLDAMEELSEFLADDYPGWSIEYSGKNEHIDFTFTK